MGIGALIMRVQFAVLPHYIGGQTYSDGLIEINTATKHPNRIRYMISTFVHEFTHVVLGWWHGWPSNPYESYRDELWCYRMQFIAEVIMCMSRVVIIEDGAPESCRVFIRRMKASHRMNAIIDEMRR